MPDFNLLFYRSLTSAPSSNFTSQFQLQEKWGNEYYVLQKVGRIKGDDVWNMFTTVHNEAAHKIGIITAAVVAIA